MARIRPEFAEREQRTNKLTTACGLWLVLLIAVVSGNAAVAGEPLSNDPVVWYANDDQPSEVPQFAEPGLTVYAVESVFARPFSRFWHPGRFLRRIGSGDAARPAGNVNALDEVVNSTWFTNRIGLASLSPAELAHGPAFGKSEADGPDRSAPWTIIGAKTAGVTPGFRIKDGRGDTWLLKFDPPSHPGMTIRSGVVANLIFHAAGFNTPVDRLVVFDRHDLVVGEGAKMKAGRIGTIDMTEANLDSVLTSTNSIFGGRYHALASRYLNGIPLGPFDDQDTRADDPNDLIKHENRRELRALRVFAGWLNHFDTKMHNSLDMYVGEPGHGHVRHHLIDFASTLGAFGDQPVKRFGYEFGFDVWPTASRLLTLGMVEDTWVQLERPEGLDEVGLFDVATFEPEHWKPDLPHSAMANLTRLDGYWAAKVISAFTDEDLRILVEQGLFQNQQAAEFLISALAGRRDKIARFWFGEVPPLDFFRIVGDQVEFMDLAIERGYAEPAQTSYRYRMAAVDADRHFEQRTEWEVLLDSAVPIPANEGGFRLGVLRPDAAHQFLSLELQVNRGDGWSASTTAFFSLHDGRTLAVDR